MGRARWMLAVAVMSGCAFSRYEPGSLITSHAYPDTRSITLGCLDVELRTTKDARVPATHPVLRFAFGNRCPQAIPVDFGRVRVAGLYERGEVPLHAVDPRHEIHPATLDGHSSGAETIEFAPTLTYARGPASLCVVLSGLTTSTLSAAEATRCFILPAQPATETSGDAS